LTSQAKSADILLGIRALQLDLDTLHNFKFVQYLQAWNFFKKKMVLSVSFDVGLLPALAPSM
jgi:hypothetical protein